MQILASTTQDGQTVSGKSDTPDISQDLQAALYHGEQLLQLAEKIHRQLDRTALYGEMYPYQCRGRTAYNFHSHIEHGGSGKTTYVRKANVLDYRKRIERGKRAKQIQQAIDLTLKAIALLETN